MPIRGGKVRFIKENVDRAPADRGVYALYDGDELIYIGRAKGGSETLRSRLQSHLRGDEGACTQRATHYQQQHCVDPVGREVALQEEFEATYGDLPRCNERIG
jgi:hypothetical protein